MAPIITAWVFGAFTSPLLLVIGIGLAHRHFAHRAHPPTNAPIVILGLAFAIIGALLFGFLAYGAIAIASLKVIWTAALLNLLAGVAAWEHLLQGDNDPCGPEAPR